MKRAFAAWLICLVAPIVAAHELEANRLTLVLQGGNHLALSFHIHYAGALHRALAPEQAYAQFVLQYAALEPQEFREAVRRAQARFETGTRIVLEEGKELAVTRWAWPEPTQVQAALRERAMQLVVAPEDHAHENVTEIRAQAAAGAQIRSLQVSVPPEFQPVLVVSYRPSQVWVGPEAPSARVRF